MTSTAGRSVGRRPSAAGQSSGCATNPLPGVRRARAASNGPNGWTLYLATPDVDATIGRVVEAGRRVLAPRTTPAEAAERPSWSTQAAPPLACGSRSPTAGSVWLPGPARRAGRAAYERVRRLPPVSWDRARVVSGPDGGRPCASVRHPRQGAQPASGIREHRPLSANGLTPGWTIFVGTTSCERSMQAVEGLGGAVLTPLEESPTGRIVTVADPMGAASNLVEVGAWPEDRNR